MLSEERERKKVIKINTHKVMEFWKRKKDRKNGRFEQISKIASILELG